jgi:nitrogenase molybdenum-iron protein alpha/beta subunit
MIERKTCPWCKVNRPIWQFEISNHKYEAVCSNCTAEIRQYQYFAVLAQKQAEHEQIKKMVACAIHGYGAIQHFEKTGQWKTCD